MILARQDACTIDVRWSTNLSFLRLSEIRALQGGETILCVFLMGSNGFLEILANVFTLSLMFLLDLWWAYMQNFQNMLRTLCLFSGSMMCVSKLSMNA